MRLIQNAINLFQGKLIWDGGKWVKHLKQYVIFNNAIIREKRYEMIKIGLGLDNPYFFK